jgi:DNA repair protein RadD
MEKSKVSLRLYQVNCVDQIRNAIKDGKRKILVCMPPGAGKGTIIGKIMADTAMNGARALFVVHRKELVTQTAARTLKQFGYNNIGFYLSGQNKSERPCMFGSIQTINARKISNNFRVVIIDEAHRIQTKSYQNLLHSLHENTILIGFTATPFRTDKKTFENDYEILIQATTYQSLAEQKFLVPTRVVAPAIAPNLKGIHVRPGPDGKEFDTQEMFERFDNERVYSGIVDSYLKWGDKRRAIVFCVNSIDHCEKVAQAFQKRGVDARAIHSKSGDRDRLYKDFDQGKYPVLVNVNLFTEGISIDDVDCIIYACGTASMTKYIQSATRASRPVWNEDYSDWLKENGEYVKTHALIIDLGGNTDRFGYVDDYDLVPFDLSGEPKKKGTAPTKTCPQCRAIVRAQAKLCDVCEYAFPWKPPKDRVFADEIDWEIRDRFVSLVNAYEKKSLSDIRSSLIKRKDAAPELLPIIQLAKGYKPDWVLHFAYQINQQRGNLDYMPFDPYIEGTLNIDSQARAEAWGTPGFPGFFVEKLKSANLYKFYTTLKKKRAEDIDKPVSAITKTF